MIATILLSVHANPEGEAVLAHTEVTVDARDEIHDVSDSHAKSWSFEQSDLLQGPRDVWRRYGDDELALELDLAFQYELWLEDFLFFLLIYHADSTATGWFE